MKKTMSYSARKRCLYMIIITAFFAVAFVLSNTLQFKFSFFLEKTANYIIPLWILTIIFLFIKKPFIALSFPNAHVLGILRVIIFSRNVDLIFIDTYMQDYFFIFLLLLVSTIISEIRFSTIFGKYTINKFENASEDDCFNLANEFCNLSLIKSFNEQQKKEFVKKQMVMFEQNPRQKVQGDKEFRTLNKKIKHIVIIFLDRKKA